MFTCLQTKIPLAPLARMIRTDNSQSAVGGYKLIKGESTSDRSIVLSNQTRSLFTSNTPKNTITRNTKRASIYNNTTLTATVFAVSSNDTSVFTVSTRDYARWSKTLKAMPKDKLNKMLEQQKKSSAYTATGDSTTPATSTGTTPAASSTGSTASAGGVNYSQRKIKVHIDATGKVADPWKPGDKSGIWMGIKRTLATKFISAMRIRSIYKKKELGTFDKDKLVEDCLDIYQRFNKQVATGNWNAMGDYVSLPVIEDMRKEFGGRKLNPEYQYNWECAQLNGSIINLVVLQIPAPLNKMFMQVTLKVTSKQELKILSRDGVFLGGSREPADVTDYFVFERSLDMKDSPIILIGRLKDA